MKTLAEFKRALTFGSMWECIHVPSGNNLGVRQLVKKQSNCVGFLTRTGSISYLYFPKASEYSFNDGYAEIWCNDEGQRRLILKYRKVEA